ncbi:hypothetical protein MSI_20740 [Treponema sp. JC4]|uniref:hypothetical protein n=1 Tax=Treponema sp. JC4 TaxID=1124982 RepID=UPI00025B078A|nr:hypothetical protein [Treponema sp. JC4]EID84428.1 hypothetical protein MSI_20740 [Treponema sp. JC4]
MSEFGLFEINLYSKEEKLFYKEKDEQLRRYLETIECDIQKVKPEIIDNFENNYISPWRYNQIFGAVRFFISGTEIRGEIFLSSLKKYVRNARQKKFRYEGKLLLEQDLLNASTEEIISAIDSSLEDLQKEYKLIPDLECYNNLKKIIDWENILTKVKSREGL